MRRVQAKCAQTNPSPPIRGGSFLPDSRVVDRDTQQGDDHKNHPKIHVRSISWLHKSWKRGDNPESAGGYSLRSRNLSIPSEDRTRWLDCLTVIRLLRGE